LEENKGFIRMRAESILYGFALMLSAIFLTVSCAKKHSNSSGNSNSSFTVYEIEQTAGSDGLSGSFVIQDNGISFLLSIFLDNNNTVKFKSLIDPDGIDILSSSSTPNLYLDASGSSGTKDEDAYGYANVLVPQSPSFSAKAGKWTFTAYNNDRVKLAMRTGNAPSNATIAVQPFITGTKWSTEAILDALDIMSGIYLKNGVTLIINSTIPISETEYSSVSKYFTDSTTSALVKKGSSDSVNIFFIMDYSDSNILGNAPPSMPGSMGEVNSWNGVLVSLEAHATGNALDSQLLGETAAHEMGHQLGLFHTTEDKGTIFDILSDTPECSRSSQDNNSDGFVSAEECDGFGGDNLMFWTTWSFSSRSSGKKQDTLSSHQQYVLKYSPMAK